MIVLHKPTAANSIAAWTCKLAVELGRTGGAHAPTVRTILCHRAKVSRRYRREVKTGVYVKPVWNNAKFDWEWNK
jgi:hypothetical protein